MAEKVLKGSMPPSSIQGLMEDLPDEVYFHSTPVGSDSDGSYKMWQEAVSKLDGDSGGAEVAHVAEAAKRKFSVGDVICNDDTQAEVLGIRRKKYDLLYADGSRGDHNTEFIDRWYNLKTAAPTPPAFKVGDFIKHKSYPDVYEVVAVEKENQYEVKNVADGRVWKSQTATVDRWSVVAPTPTAEAEGEKYWFWVGAKSPELYAEYPIRYIVAAGASKPLNFGSTKEITKAEYDYLMARPDGAKKLAAPVLDDICMSSQGAIYRSEGMANKRFLSGKRWILDE